MEEPTIAAPGPHILFVSTFPPTACGLATFTQALVETMATLRGASEGLGVARVHTATDTSISLDPVVHTEVSVESPSWPDAIVGASRSFDAVWIQHEFGIFGPDDGGGVLDLARATSVPVFTTLHTVLAESTRNMRWIIESLVRSSEKVIVMSEAARARLIDTHRVDVHKVAVIPHGSHRFRRVKSRTSGRPTIATWGLLGPGKGIELGIQAMAHLRHLVPLPVYVVRGATHPNVLRTQGEAYRHTLAELSTALEVDDIVDMADGYLTGAQLADLIGRADLALLPYDSTEQVTSGVLAEAVGAGIPVVATAFPHASEMLKDGAGRVVPHGDAKAMASAIEHYLTRPRALRAAAIACRQLATALTWTAVARRYEEIATKAAAVTTTGAA